MHQMTASRLADIFTGHNVEVAKRLRKLGNKALSGDNLMAFMLEYAQEADCSLVNGVYAIIQKYGDMGATTRDIYKNSRGFARLDGRAQRAVLEKLAADGRIAEHEIKRGNGHIRIAWVAAVK